MGDYGLPGQTGQASRASSQTCNDEIEFSILKFMHGLAAVSIWKLSRRIARATGWGAAFGLTPALNTSNQSPPALRSRYSARMLRAEFLVHRKRVLKRAFCMFIGIGGRFLLSSIRSGRGHSGMIPGRGIRLTVCRFLLVPPDGLPLSTVQHD